MRLRKRRPQQERIDPFGVGEPWRLHVRRALQAQARYDQAVGSLPAGSLRERLEEVGRRVEEATQQCWRVARRGDALEAAVSGLDVAGLRERLAAHTGSAVPAVGEENPVVASLEAQLVTAERLQAAAADARMGLGLLEARLDEAVATAVSLSALAADPVDAGTLGADLELVVEDLAALRSALEESEELGR